MVGDGRIGIQSREGCARRRDWASSNVLCSGVGSRRRRASRALSVAIFGTSSHRPFFSPRISLTPRRLHKVHIRNRTLPSWTRSLQSPSHTTLHRRVGVENPEQAWMERYAVRQQGSVCSHVRVGDTTCMASGLLSG